MDIERIFNKDCRDKKRIAIGVYKRASRRGYIRGGVRTPSDYLTTKQRKKLNGEVKVSNMYNKIESLPELSAIKKMDYNQIKNTLTIAKHNFTNKELTNRWSISSGSLYNMFEKYGVEFSKRGKRTSNRVAKADVVEINNNPDIIELINNLKEEINSLKKSNSFNYGIKISFKGDFLKEDIVNKLNMISGAMDDDSIYKVSINIEQSK